MVDFLLHALGGAVVCGLCLIVGAPALVAVAAPLAFGIARESAQRKWESPLKFSTHAGVEALAWPAGAALLLIARAA
jgi:hypothetical protein